MAAPIEDPCEQYETLDIAFLNSSCDPTVTFSVKNDNGYDSITFTPALPISHFMNYSSYFIYSTVTPGIYNLTAISGLCNQTRTLEIVVPSIVITQPKCFGGPLTINATGYRGEVSFAVDDMDLVTKNNSYNFESDMDPSSIHQLVVSVPNVGAQPCKVYFPYDTTNSFAPKLVITHPTCGLSDGKIVVTNFAEFTSITLQSNTNDDIFPDANGVFSNLNSTTARVVNFGIYAESAKCSHTLLYPGVLIPFTPTMTLSGRAVDACNKTHGIYKFTLTGATKVLPDGMNITVDGTTVVELGVEFVFSVGSYQVQLSTCADPVTYDFANYFLPVTHTIGPNGQQPTCSVTTTATVAYPFDYANLTVSPTNLDSNHQLQVIHDQTYLAMSKCFPQQSRFAYPKVHPYYYVNYTDTSCIGVYQVTVRNYAAFDSIFMSYQDIIKTAVNGVIYDVFLPLTGDWVLTTIEKGCTVQRNLTVTQINNPLDNGYFTFEITNVTQDANAGCLSPYSATIYPHYKGIRSTQGTYVEFNNSNNGFVQTTYFASEHCPPTPVIYREPAPPTNAQVTVHQHAPCLQTVGLINVTYTEPLLYLLFNGSNVIIRPSGQLYEVPVGTTNVKIVFKAPNFQCQQIIPVTLHAIDTTTILSLQITPQDSSNCSAPSGKVMFTTAWSNFNSAMLLGEEDVPFDNVTGVATVGTYYTSAKFDHKTCGKGIINNVFIPTDNKVTISLTPLYKSSCKDSTSAPNSAQISLLHSNGRYIYPDNIYSFSPDFDLSYNFFTGVIYGMPLGNLTARITHDYCQWDYNFVQNIDTKPVFKVNIVKMPTVGMLNGVAQIVMLRDDLYVGTVQASSGYATPDRSQIIGWGYNHEQPLMNFTLSEAPMGCVYRYQVNLTNEITTPRYTVIEPTECGSKTYQLKFDQVSMQLFEIYVSDTAPDINGVVSVNAFNNGGLKFRSIVNPALGFTSVPIVGLVSYLTSFGNIEVKYTTTPETCISSRDGTLTITNANPEIYTYSLVNTDNNYQADTLITGNTVQFRFLESSLYILNVYLFSNPYCVNSQMVLVPQTEPELVISAPNVCSDGQNFTSISMRIEPSTFTATYKINGDTVNPTTTHLPPGTYVVEASISAGVCSRSINQKVTMQYSVISDTLASYQCGQLSYNTYAERQSYAKVQLIDSKNNVVKVDTEIQYQMNYFNLDTGSYRVITTDISGCMVATNPVAVTSCTPVPNYHHYPPPPLPSTTGPSSTTTSQSTTTTGPSSTTTTDSTTTTTTGTTNGLNGSSQTTAPTVLILMITFILLSLI
ncbi:hypothetical protein SAMD00019534_004980 [Acytostelium subglobosum LB1]|uniref:hypothetical protein n=1 Tax=Acytostelium subglobosum LB1 TaxID=1410327 RepID=UPI000644F538|nr:hypothetical protein SAMD00019534_004980 [Acytostelium subglobosum LB1]GAM17323.1 hypothetical protein SAMD00019534_004980 [Acytostelium subglobosum LB1]|eukprot:XP_012759385.1 hypothetical protein SAMD00019534_004980 [Acytostelium subglobosum LB1]